MKIGFAEILVILGVALLVFGPDKTPYYAKKLGEALKEFKKLSSDATKDIRESIIEPLEEAQKPLKEAIEPITEMQKDIQGEVTDIKKSFTSLGKTPKAEPKEKSEKVPEEGPKEIPEEQKAAETCETEAPSAEDTAKAV